MTPTKTKGAATGRSGWHWPILLAATVGVLILLPVSSEILWGTIPLVVACGLTVAIVAALLLLPAIRIGPKRYSGWLGKWRRRLRRPHR